MLRRGAQPDRNTREVPSRSYKVEAVLEAEKLQRFDLAVDFLPAKRALEAIAKEFDYRYINEHPAFIARNTSAENLARYFAERLETSGVLGAARIAEVTVWEGPENRATYRTPQEKPLRPESNR